MAASRLARHGADERDRLGALASLRDSGRALTVVFARRSFRVALCVLGIAASPLIPSRQWGSGVGALDTTTVLSILVA